MALIQDNFRLAPSRYSLFLIAALASLLVQSTQARGWEDVVEVSIYARSHVDLPRIQFAIEDDPLNVAPTAILLSESQPPSDAPSTVPTYYAQEEEEEEEVEAIRQPPRLECGNGEAAFKVNKYDTWGDGWGETTISIRRVNRLEGDPQATVAISQDVSLEDYRTSAATEEPRTEEPWTQEPWTQEPWTQEPWTEEPTATEEPIRYVNPRNAWRHDNRALEDYILIGGLKSGDYHSQNVCLSYTACYEVTLQGGKWQEEAKWDIVPLDADEGTSAASQAIAKGRGFSNCTFHVTDEPINHPNCPFTCRPRQEPEPEPEQEEVDEEAEEEVEEAEVIPEVEEAKLEEEVIRNGELSLNLTEPEAEGLKSAPESEAVVVPSQSPTDAPASVPTL